MTIFMIERVFHNPDWGYTATKTCPQYGYFYLRGEATSKADELNREAMDDYGFEGDLADWLTVDNDEGAFHTVTAIQHSSKVVL